MNFLEYYEDQTTTMHPYIYDCSNDYIGFTLKDSPVAEHSMTPIYRTDSFVYLNKRTHFLLYILHKLNVRPPL